MASGRPALSREKTTPGELLIVLGLTFVSAIFFLSVSFPLATYTLSLALFGFAHVLSELRYIDLRYGTGIGKHLRITLGLLLLGIVAIRVSQIAGWLRVSDGLVLEISLVLLLSLSVIPHLYRRSLVALGVGLLVSAALLTGLLLSPIHTLLILAILHNLTPMGFLADALPPGKRAVYLGMAALVFVVIPLFIASGLPFDLLRSLGWAHPEASILPAGPLSSHIGAYLHPSFHGRAWALHAFSAVVFAQCMHYAVVIHVLPRLLPSQAKGLLPWPKLRTFTWILIVSSAAFFIFFFADFQEARKFYGVAAAVHAWVEVPILMLALLAGFGFVAWRSPGELAATR